MVKRVPIIDVNIDRFKSTFEERKLHVYPGWKKCPWNYECEKIILNLCYPRVENDLNDFFVIRLEYYPRGEGRKYYLSLDTYNQMKSYYHAWFSSRKNAYKRAEELMKNVAQGKIK
jgi:hypothetical protein